MISFRSGVNIERLVGDKERKYAHVEPQMKSQNKLPPLKNPNNYNQHSIEEQN